MFRFLFVYALMVVGASLLATVSGCPSLFALPPSMELLLGSLAAATVGALGVVFGGTLLETVPWYRAMAGLLKRLLTAPELLGPELNAQKAFVIAVYSSIGEEALFRGWLQPWTIKLLEGWLDQPGELLPVALGIVITSVIFGLVHFPVMKELRPWTLFAGLVSLMFGTLAAASGSLAAPVLAHFLINWLNLRRLAKLPLTDAAGPQHP